jgi:hypothetical protein
MKVRRRVKFDRPRKIHAADELLILGVLAGVLTGTVQLAFGDVQTDLDAVHFQTTLRKDPSPL